MQIALFDLPPAPVEPPTWERIPGPKQLGSKGIVHVHLPSQMQVHHCGHPTANFPYYILDIQGERQILAPNGRGFQHLVDAKQHVEQLHKAIMQETTTESCRSR